MLGIWYLAWNLARVLIPTAPDGVQFPSDVNQIAGAMVLAVDGDFFYYGMSFALH